MLARHHSYVICSQIGQKRHQPKQRCWLCDCHMLELDMHTQHMPFISSKKFIHLFLTLWCGLSSINLHFGCEIGWSISVVVPNTHSNIWISMIRPSLKYIRIMANALCFVCFISRLCSVLQWLQWLRLICIWPLVFLRLAMSWQLVDSDLCIFVVVIVSIERVHMHKWHAERETRARTMNSGHLRMAHTTA